MAAIIFDLDGTLVESVGAIRDIANAYMAERGLAALTLDEARLYIGHGSPHFLRQALTTRGAYDATSFDVEFAKLHAHYSNAPPEANAPMPGVDEALRSLRAAGDALAMCTNKPLAPTLRIVDSHGWSDLFSIVLGGDSLEQRKPHPAPLLKLKAELGQADVLYVGDSEVDAATAEAAQIPFLFFTKGYCNVPLDQLVIAERFDDFDALPAIVDRLTRA